MDEVTIEEFTIPFEMSESIVVCENDFTNKFYEGTIEHLFTGNDRETLNMRVDKALVRDNKLYVIAHY